MKKQIKWQKLQQKTTKEILTTDFEGTITSQRHLIRKLVHDSASGGKKENQTQRIKLDNRT